MPASVASALRRRSRHRRSSKKGRKASKRSRSASRGSKTRSSAPRRNPRSATRSAKSSRSGRSRPAARSKARGKAASSRSRSSQRSGSRSSASRSGRADPLLRRRNVLRQKLRKAYEAKIKQEDKMYSQGKLYDGILMALTLVLLFGQLAMMTYAGYWAWLSSIYDDIAIQHFPFLIHTIFVCMVTVITLALVLWPHYIIFVLLMAAHVIWTIRSIWLAIVEYNGRGFCDGIDWDQCGEAALFQWRTSSPERADLRQSAVLFFHLWSFLGHKLAVFLCLFGTVLYFGSLTHLGDSREGRMMLSRVRRRHQGLPEDDPSAIRVVKRGPPPPLIVPQEQVSAKTPKATRSNKSSTRSARFPRQSSSILDMKNPIKRQMEAAHKGDIGSRHTRTETTTHEVQNQDDGSVCVRKERTSAVFVTAIVPPKGPRTPRPNQAAAAPLTADVHTPAPRPSLKPNEAVVQLPPSYVGISKMAPQTSPMRALGGLASSSGPATKPSAYAYE